MILTREQIAALQNKMGIIEANRAIEDFCLKIKPFLSSNDVIQAYDEAFYRKLDNHPVVLEAQGFKINKYSYFSFVYLSSKLKKTDRVLDIGCGRGDFILYLLSTGFVQKATGVDFDKKSIEWGKSQASKYSLNCDLFCDDVNSIELAEKFDFVILNDVVEHLSDAELSKIFTTISQKLLKKNGEVIIHTPNGLAGCCRTGKNFRTYVSDFVTWLFKCEPLYKSVEQIFHEQVHINVKSYSAWASFMKKKGYRTQVIYDAPPPANCMPGRFYYKNKIVVV